MKKSASYITFICILSIWTPTGAHAFQCQVCHSRNPAMVRMHKAVQAKEIGCFDCHSPGEKLMGRAAAKDRESLLLRRSKERPCIDCHAN